MRELEKKTEQKLETINTALVNIQKRNVILIHKILHGMLFAYLFNDISFKRDIPKWNTRSLRNTLLPIMVRSFTIQFNICKK